MAMASLALFVPQARAERSQSKQRTIQPEARQLLTQANEAREAQGLKPLDWDTALAAAAREHCLRMAAEGSIAHQYRGELALADRAGHAGAHFSLIEENVALAPDPASIHNGWMHSPGHRSNLLNSEVNRVGIAVVAGRNGLYAVADYAKDVQLLTATQVETTVARLLRTEGIGILTENSAARAACVQDHGMPRGKAGEQPRFVMRWQDAQLNQLPRALTERIQTGKYRRAAIGSCPAQVAEGAFTAYRVAVLLY
jgi:hypothetical protein